MSSKISNTVKYGIVTSQFHRLRRIILKRRNLVDKVADMLQTFTNKGHNIDDMLGRVRFLCWQHPELFGILADDLVTQIRSTLHRLTGLRL